MIGKYFIDKILRDINLADYKHSNLLTKIKNSLINKKNSKISTKNIAIKRLLNYLYGVY